MKTIPIALADHYAQPSTTWAHGLKVTRQDGAVFGFTSSGQDVTIDGQLYGAAQGLTITNIDTSAGLDVDNLELTTLDDGSLFTHADILAGVWRNASFLIFRYNWASPTDGIEPLIAGVTGECQMNRNTIVLELRGLQQYLQTIVGSPSSKLCRYRFGVNDGYTTKCPVDAATFTFAGTITGVTSLQVFAASAIGKPDDYFTEGEVKFLTGANAGRTVKVKTFVAAGGVFTFALPLYSAAAIGDTFSATAGCMKRWQEDCDAKFGAALDFGGEPHRPGVDALTATPQPGTGT
jgi:uncharacterized phage protein (TIGR02218 family)